MLSSSVSGSRTALWRSLHAPGHDTALLTESLAGWNLVGMASFLGPKGPAAVNYSVEVDKQWMTRRGSLRGFSGGRRFHHAIERTPDGWTLDGSRNGMADVTDLDFGFTPATNLLQLQRAALKVGERAEFSVAWFDLGRFSLVELPQIYERQAETLYRYISPPSGYDAVLEIDEGGFVKVYPDLWEMEAKSTQA
jgi:hypothetical protein